MTKKTTANVLPFRTQYTGNVRIPFETTGESLTQQQFAEESQIQNIVKKYDSQGFFDTINRNPAQYGDFTQITDLHSAMSQINEAKENFMTIPSPIRERFNNDPQQFYSFASDENNFDELVDMGLATQRVPDNPVSSPVVEEKKDQSSVETTNISKED
tara:strand:+ start:3402 stop:3875 length:474 start_codon:yes stop_codon:yes gene_type:complete